MMTDLYSPLNLWDLAFHVLSHHSELICKTDQRGHPRRLLDHVKLPWIVCDPLLECWAKSHLPHDTAVFIFSDPRKASVRRINLRRSKISDVAIMTLTKQRPLDLDLQDCNGLTSGCLLDIVKLKSLQSLNLSGCSTVLRDYNHIMKFFLPNLKKLDISYTQLSSMHLFLLLGHLPKLLALNVSGLVKNGDMKFLEHHQHQLTTLILHDCIILDSSLYSICKIRTLRHLDISVAESNNAYHLTPFMLRLLVKSLPNLTYLDLSGNLLKEDTDVPVDRTSNGATAAEDFMDSDSDDDRIEADAMDASDSTDGRVNESSRNRFSLASLLADSKRKFEFLGLIHVDDNVTEQLPAMKVANLSCEKNILTAMQVYKERRQFALLAMNAFFDTIRAVDCKEVVECVRAITSIMNTYPGNGQMQIPGSASLFHLSRSNYRTNFSTQTKQSIIVALIDAIEKCRRTSNVTLLRNCGLTLLNFDIPGDFCFDFERVVKNLINVLQTKDSDGLLPRIYVYMCNSIVCHVEGEKKLQVGKLGLVQCMLQLIKNGVDRRRYDEVMETAWSALWNVTDETPYNCEVFISGDGMDLFLSSLQAFPEKPDLLRNMMGLIGNVAEVPRLRRHLKEHVGVFIELLQNKSDGIEISYNAAGTLSHIASDGSQHWLEGSVTRQEMLQELEAAIDSWDINSQRNINYRSFEPILRLLDENHTYQVHLWAAWAIANLCTVSPDKYCTLLQKENGSERLQRLSSRAETPDKVKKLISTAIRVYDEHTK